MASCWPSALHGGVAVQWLGLLVVTRFVLTVARCGSGAAGGIFAPLLVIGALGGLGFGHAVAASIPSVAIPPVIFAVVGMGGFLTAIVRAPLTGIVLMVELTGKYDFMLPLWVCCLASHGVAEALGSVPVGRCAAPPREGPGRRSRSGSRPGSRRLRIWRPGNRPEQSVGVARLLHDLDHGPRRRRHPGNGVRRRAARP